MLFPDPDSPVTATKSCASIRKLTSSSAKTTFSPCWYRRVTFFNSIMPITNSLAPVKSAVPFSPCCGISSFIVYEDDRFLVIDKPANLLVHPTGPGGSDTLWDELKRFLAFEIVNGARISFVNRLDRETSGLILVAKTTDAARQLGLMIAQHRIRKTYTAIVFGWPAEEKYVVDQPLLRQGTVLPSRIWLKQAVHPDGYPALTSFVSAGLSTNDNVRPDRSRTENRPNPPDSRTSCVSRTPDCRRQNLRAG